MANTYRHVALGGTFDRLHIGHEHLIKTATKHAHQLTIGLTTHTLTKHKDYAHNITDYCVRKNELKRLLKKYKFLNQTKIIPLHDLYGTTLSDSSIDAIVVTPHTKPGAIEVNRERTRLNKTKLPIITASLIKDDNGKYISSTKIRMGKINRKGKVYAHVFKNDIIFSPKQKNQLKHPQGKLIKSPTDINKELLNESYTTLVGDVITQFSIDHKLPFNYAIVDYCNNHQPFKLDRKWWNPKHVLQTSNNWGIISAKASKVIENAFQLDNVLVEVDGEEDLLGFPAVLLMPLDSTVLYGQPQEGVVMIKVNETTKDNLVRFINER